MCWQNMGAILHCRMDASVFELTCLPRSLVTCKLRVPSVDVFVSRRPAIDLEYVCLSVVGLS